jgi:hypothetical protein
MIDSMLKFNLNCRTTGKLAPWTQWLLSSGRDGNIIMWKLMDGVLVNRGNFQEVPTFEKVRQQFKLERLLEKTKQEQARREQSELRRKESEKKEEVK